MFASGRPPVRSGKRYAPLLAAAVLGLLLSAGAARAQEAGPVATRSSASAHAEDHPGSTTVRPLSFRGTPSPGDPPLRRLAPPDTARRSPWLAAGLSAVLPGGGQAYNRDWIKAGVAVGLEAAFWTGWAIWRSEGRAGRRRYRQYAHAHFDPARYAEWLNAYPGYQGDPIPVEELVGGVDFDRPERWSDAERAAVARLVDAIRTAESEAHFAGSPSSTFSHQLPSFGDQQYYELIGKYHQYAAGWDDCGSGCDERSPSERFRRYAEIHGEANTNLRRASRVTALLLVNHGLAALDGLLSAQLHNHRIDTRARLVPGRRGGIRTRLAIRYRW